MPQLSNALKHALKVSLSPTKQQCNAKNVKALAKLVITQLPNVFHALLVITYLRVNVLLYALILSMVVVGFVNFV